MSSENREKNKNRAIFEKFLWIDLAKTFSGLTFASTNRSNKG
jgi:hypothetical protein